MRPSKGIYKKHLENGTKPPVHFHRHQYESFEVIGAGDFTVEIDGVQHRIRKGDPPAVVPPYRHHVVYGTPGVEQAEVDFILSSKDDRNKDDKKKDADALRQQYLLDRMFFENWYGYQEEVFQGKTKFDFIQILSVSCKSTPLNFQR